MNIVFWFFIALIATIIWACLAFVFPFIGKVIFNIIKDTKDIMMEKENKE